MGIIMSKTILIVDDDEMTRRLLRLFFKRHGYDVIEAENGQESLGIIEENCPDLAIIDILMPVMDGLATVHKIRSKLDCTELPILIFTTRTDIETKDKGLKAGAQRFLQKPVHLGELEEIIEELLAESQVEIVGN
jgi:DNA-binding response OmpR family regulator